MHLVGKGVLRFHAVYWPAILLSAAEPLPTDILVHDYLTINGQKISKSAAAAVPPASGGAGLADPAALADKFGTDAVRWWLLREVPRVGDADFTIPRLVARANDDLANGIGNLISRVVSLVHRYRDGKVPRSSGEARANDGAGALRAAWREAPGGISAALAAFDFRAAIAAVWDTLEEANRYVERAQPWNLAKAERAGDACAGHRLDAVLDALVTACRVLARQVEPFVPDLAAGIAAACDDSAGRLPDPRPLFPRLE